MKSDTIWMTRMRETRNAIWVLVVVYSGSGEIRNEVCPVALLL